MASLHKRTSKGTLRQLRNVSTRGSLQSSRMLRWAYAIMPPQATQCGGWQKLILVIGVFENFIRLLEVVTPALGLPLNKQPAGRMLDALAPNGSPVE